MKIAIITGASSGMGAEFARQIDKKCLGIDELWLIARREQRMQELAKELSCKTKIYLMDLTDESSYLSLKSALEEKKPKVRILINAAGVGKTGQFDEVTDEMHADMLDLNCSALTKLTRLVLPYMTRRSYLIFLASSAAFLPQPSFAVYAATKSYVLSLGRALNAELKERGISVTCVCPGPVDTEFLELATDTGKPEGIKKYFVAPADKVVTCALKDTFAKKELSVYGIPMKMLLFASKLLPHKLLVDTYQSISRDTKAAQ